MVRRNLVLFYILESILAFSGGIILPVYVVYFRHFGISLFQVALLAAVFEGTILIFELPTGRLADRYGRKLSTITGFISFGLAGLIFMIFRNWPGFILAEIFMGMGEAFISGALEALVVDSLPEDKRDDRLAGLFANRSVFRTGFYLLGMLFGGFIAVRFIDWLFFPMVGLGWLGAIMSAGLVESSSNGSHKCTERRKLADLFRFVFSNRMIPALFMVGLLTNFIFEPVDQFWQVLFSEIRGFNVESFGFLTAAGLLLAVLSVKFTARLYDRLGRYLAGCLILIAVSIFLSVAGPPGPAMAGLIVYFTLKELLRPAISTHLNRSFKAHDRATYLSGYNLTCSIGEVAAGIVAGILAATAGVVPVFYMAAFLSIPVLGVYLFLAKRKK